MNCISTNDVSTRLAASLESSARRWLSATHESEARDAAKQLWYSVNEIQQAGGKDCAAKVFDQVRSDSKQLGLPFVDFATNVPSQNDNNSAWISIEPPQPEKMLTSNAAKLTVAVKDDFFVALLSSAELNSNGHKLDIVLHPDGIDPEE